MKIQLAVICIFFSPVHITAQQVSVDFGAKIGVPMKFATRAGEGRRSGVPTNGIFSWDSISAAFLFTKREAAFAREWPLRIDPLNFMPDGFER